MGQHNGSSGKGTVSVVGIGPGGLEHLTARAREAVESAEVIVGYTRYVELVSTLAAGKEVFTSGMTQELERCERAVELARKGSRVAVVSSGDAGIYGMAGLVMQVASKGEGEITVDVVPGVPAFVAAGAVLGSPLMHDFASISLSDLLTPWETIEKRLEAASTADFVIVLYNPRSKKRTEGLGRAMEIIGRQRDGSTPVGIVRNVTREGESSAVTTMGGFVEYYETVDMLTIIIVGNSTSYIENGRIITPRGYSGV